MGILKWTFKFQRTFRWLNRPTRPLKKTCNLLTLSKPVKLYFSAFCFFGMYLFCKMYRKASCDWTDGLDLKKRSGIFNHWINRDKLTFLLILKVEPPLPFCTFRDTNGSKKKNSKDKFSISLKGRKVEFLRFYLRSKDSWPFSKVELVCPITQTSFVLFEEQVYTKKTRRKEFPLTWMAEKSYFIDLFKGLLAFF